MSGYKTIHPGYKTIHPRKISPKLLKELVIGVSGSFILPRSDLSQMSLRLFYIVYSEFMTGKEQQRVRSPFTELLVDDDYRVVEAWYSGVPDHILTTLFSRIQFHSRKQLECFVSLLGEYDLSDELLTKKMDSHLISVIKEFILSPSTADLEWAAPVMKCLDDERAEAEAKKNLEKETRIETSKRFLENQGYLVTLKAKDSAAKGTKVGVEEDPNLLMKDTVKKSTKR